MKIHTVNRNTTSNKILSDQQTEIIIGTSMDPLVLIFDLDHTLFDVQVDKTEATLLSASAEIDAAEDDAGVVFYPPLKFDHASECVRKAYKV